jgi:GT2 family glycosyltransferase
MGNVSLRRSDAIRVGLDEPRMDGRRHEDRELGIRLARAGLRALVVPELVARHDHHRTAEAFAADCRAEGAGLRALHDLHGVALPARIPLAASIERAARPLAGRSLLAARILRRAAIAAGAAA